MVQRSATRLRALTLLLLLVGVVGCQSPAPSQPTPAPATSVPTPATPVPAPATPVPTRPLTVIAPPVGSSRVDTLNAANSAFAQGDTTAASELYDRVLNTPPIGEPAATASVMDAYAQFRAIVTLLAVGREEDAHAHLEALQQSDPSAPLARLANQLWDQYGMIGQLRGACAQLQPQIATQAGPTLAALQALGVSVDAQSLCSVPQG